MKCETLTATLGFAAAIGLATSAYSPVQAASITFEEKLASFSSNAVAWIPKFNPTLGTLNFVQITYDIDVSVGINFDRSSEPQTATIEPNVLRLFGPAPVLGGNAQLAFQDFGQELTIQPGEDFGGGFIFPFDETIERGFAYTETFDSRGTTVGSSTQNDFGTGVYTGSFGVVEFLFNAALDDPLTIIGPQPNLSVFPFVSGFVHVTYDYNDGTEEEEVSTVPVPAALPLMISALGTIGFMARRRKST